MGGKSKLVVAGLVLLLFIIQLSIIVGPVSGSEDADLNSNHSDKLELQKNQVESHINIDNTSEYRLLASPSGEINIDNDDSAPPLTQELEPGKEYTFNIQVGYELSNVDSGEIALYFPQLEREVSTSVSSTSGQETETLSFTDTVPAEDAGDQLTITAQLLDSNGEYVDLDDTSYDIGTGENTPPTIENFSPSEEGFEAAKGATLDFSASGADADGDDLTYTWYTNEVIDGKDRQKQSRYFPNVAS